MAYFLKYIFGRPKVDESRAGGIELNSFLLKREVKDKVATVKESTTLLTKKKIPAFLAASSKDKRDEGCILVPASEISLVSLRHLACVEFINKRLIKNPVLGKLLPSADQQNLNFNSIDGLLLCKVVNACAPGILDERAVNLPSSSSQLSTLQQETSHKAEGDIPLQADAYVLQHDTQSQVQNLMLVPHVVLNNPQPKIPEELESATCQSSKSLSDGIQGKESGGEMETLRFLAATACNEDHQSPMPLPSKPYDPLGATHKSSISTGAREQLSSQERHENVLLAALSARVMGACVPDDLVEKLEKSEEAAVLEFIIEVMKAGFLRLLDAHSCPEVPGVDHVPESPHTGDGLTQDALLSWSKAQVLQAYPGQLGADDLSETGVPKSAEAAGKVYPLLLSRILSTAEPALTNGDESQGSIPTTEVLKNVLDTARDAGVDCPLQLEHLTHPHEDFHVLFIASLLAHVSTPHTSQSNALHLESSAASCRSIHDSAQDLDQDQDFFQELGAEDLPEHDDTCQDDDNNNLVHSTTLKVQISPRSDLSTFLALSHKFQSARYATRSDGGFQLRSRAESMRRPCLQAPSGALGVREERLQCAWLNSLIRDKPLTSLRDSRLKTGWPLLQALDALLPGCVDWRAAFAPPFQPKTRRIKSIQNCNQVISICTRRLGLTLVGIGGTDLAAGSLPIVLALIWQLIRYQTTRALREAELSGANGSFNVFEHMMPPHQAGIIQGREPSLSEPPSPATLQVDLNCNTRLHEPLLHTNLTDRPISRNLLQNYGDGCNSTAAGEQVDYKHLNGTRSSLSQLSLEASAVESTRGNDSLCVHQSLENPYPRLNGRVSDAGAHQNFSDDGIVRTDQLLEHLQVNERPRMHDPLEHAKTNVEEKETCAKSLLRGGEVSKGSITSAVTDHAQLATRGNGCNGERAASSTCASPLASPNRPRAKSHDVPVAHARGIYPCGNSDEPLHIHKELHNCNTTVDSSMSPSSSHEASNHDDKASTESSPSISNREHHIPSYAEPHRNPASVVFARGQRDKFSVDPVSPAHGAARRSARFKSPQGLEQQVLAWVNVKLLASDVHGAPRLTKSASEPARQHRYSDPSTISSTGSCIPAPQPRRIRSFSDPALSDGVALLHVLAAVRPHSVNMEFVFPGTTLMEREANARYAVSVTRKLGLDLFLAWEDVAEAHPQMMLMLFAALMTLDLQSTTPS